MSTHNWTQLELKTVTFITVGNGLLLGFLSWLVLDLWLNIAFRHMLDRRNINFFPAGHPRARPGDRKSGDPWTI
jgi:hypothetical protein